MTKITELVEELGIEVEFVGEVKVENDTFFVDEIGFDSTKYNIEDTLQLHTYIQDNFNRLELLLIKEYGKGA